MSTNKNLATANSLPQNNEWFTADGVSIQFSERVPFEQWQELGGWLQQISHSLSFFVGDWLNEGEKEYGDKYVQAVHFTDYRIETLRNVKYVCNAVKREVRIDAPNVSFTHHRLVAPLAEDPALQRQLLEQARDEGISTRDFALLVKEYRGEILDDEVAEPEESQGVFIDFESAERISDTMDEAMQTTDYLVSVLKGTDKEAAKLANELVTAAYHSIFG